MGNWASFEKWLLETDYMPTEEVKLPLLASVKECVELFRQDTGSNDQYAAAIEQVVAALEPVHRLMKQFSKYGAECSETFTF